MHVSADRVHLSVDEARDIARRALGRLGYDSEEASIVAEHTLDAALCGYEYSGLAKILNVAEHPQLRKPRHDMRARHETDVSAMWDKVWEQTPSWMRSVSREFVDAGADIVVSHGVLVLHGVEIYQGKPIFYSLGNFIFQPFSDADVWLNERIWLSVVATCRYDGEALERIDFIPIAVGGQDALRRKSYEDRDAPEIATGRYADVTLGWLAELSAVFGSRIEVTGDRAVLVRRD